MNLLNQIEKIAYRERSEFRPYDAMTSAAFLYSKQIIGEINQYNATIELAGHNTRGQLILDTSSKIYNVNIIQTISQTIFERILLWTAKYN